MDHLCFVAVFCVLIAWTFADTPANCTHGDFLGIWNFYEGARNGGRDISCGDFKGPISYVNRFELKDPDVVEDAQGRKGFWTAVYNQGFEVVINRRKYFAFSKYVESKGYVTSYCDKVIPGWSHDVTGKNWACFNAKKIYPLTEPKIHKDENLPEETTVFNQSKEFITQIHQSQKSWTAFAYPELDKMTTTEYIRRSGGIKSRMHRSRSVQKELPDHLRQLISQLPEEIDWRNVNGSNYVPPVRIQNHCGSCFAFATLDMMASRLRIATNNSIQVLFSPQDVISCSQYSQGCDGGFPYLAGKYAQDFGIVTEECWPYTGITETCVKRSCKRYYAADYKYVGGYFGASNEDAMKLELVTNGPIVAGFEANKEFHYYKGGIYHRIGFIQQSPVPLVNHALLIIGYGVDKDSGEKFWIAKNTYGTDWGENGFLRIRRGHNECNIESVVEAVTLFP